MSDEAAERMAAAGHEAATAQILVSRDQFGDRSVRLRQALHAEARGIRGGFCDVGFCESVRLCVRHDV